MAPVVVHVRGMSVALTEETISATWKHFADQCRACAAAAKAGEFHVNDLRSYVDDQEALARMFEAREGRMSLGFLQRAVFIQTGECPPILAP